jgi:hypothetical protein
MRDTVDRSLQFMAGGGKVGALMRGYDWGASPLGHPATWPQSLGHLGRRPNEFADTGKKQLQDRRIVRLMVGDDQVK